MQRALGQGDITYGPLWDTSESRGPVNTLLRKQSVIGSGELGSPTGCQSLGPFSGFWSLGLAGRGTQRLLRGKWLHPDPPAPLAQEAAQIHTGAHAALWRPLHRLHGHAIHRGLRDALASPDALRDALQLLPGAQPCLRVRGGWGWEGCFHPLQMQLWALTQYPLSTGIFCRHHILFLQRRGKR